MKSVNSDLDVRKPDATWDVTNPKELSRLSMDPEIVSHICDIIQDWCSKIQSFVDSSDQERWETPDAGPDTELEYWKRRVQKVNYVMEKVKSKDPKAMIHVVTHSLKVTRNSTAHSPGRRFLPPDDGPSVLFSSTLLTAFIC